MWVVEVDPEFVNVTLQWWWQEVIQTRHHVIWARYLCVMYTCTYVCTATDVLAELGGVSGCSASRGVSQILKDDMAPSRHGERAVLCCAELS